MLAAFAPADCPLLPRPRVLFRTPELGAPTLVVSPAPALFDVDAVRPGDLEQLGVQTL